MSTSALLVYSGFAAAVFLFASSQTRGLSIVAVIASGIEVLEHLNILHLSFGRIPGHVFGLVLALGLAVPALIAWFRAPNKAAITASAIATFVGAVQALELLLRGGRG